MSLINVKDIPSGHKKRVYVPACTVAGGSIKHPIMRAEKGLKVTAVHFIGQGGFTAADTNYWKASVINAGTAGTGTTEIANKSFVAATGNLVALSPNSITLSATAANLLVSVGETIAYYMIKTGTPATDWPQGVIEIEFAYT
jgi:hypothetical protein